MPGFERMAEPVLCIAAHPEDIEIHAGGTVARLVQAGRQVAYVLCTSGNRGTSDPTRTSEDIVAIREKEQRRAAAILGVQDITFLRHDDGDLQYVARELREKIVRLIRQKRPRTIITHDPFPGDGSHDIRRHREGMGDKDGGSAGVREPGAAPAGGAGILSGHRRTIRNEGRRRIGRGVSGVVAGLIAMQSNPTIWRTDGDSILDYRLKSPQGGHHDRVELRWRLRALLGES